MASENRFAIHAYLSEDAHGAWQEFAGENGVSVTGLIESIGLDWAEALTKGPNEDQVRQVKAARKIDASRRRRNRAGS